MHSRKAFIRAELEHAKRETRIAARRLGEGNCLDALGSLLVATTFSGGAMRTAIHEALHDSSESMRDLKIQTYEQNNDLSDVADRFRLSCVRR